TFRICACRGATPSPETRIEQSGSLPTNTTSSIRSKLFSRPAWMTISLAMPLLRSTDACGSVAEPEIATVLRAAREVLRPQDAEVPHAELAVRLEQDVAVVAGGVAPRIVRRARAAGLREVLPRAAGDIPLGLDA